jgi:meso-butanediol dehydrogenase / (S,S)-butanediol dehydrogenase / diacetyl reductase
VVVNNAGAGFADWDETIAVNATGPYLVASGAAPFLAARGGGTIVNVASVAALVAGPGEAAYASSKGAVVMLTRALAVELGTQGIRVNALCPGWVRTPMADESMDELAELRGLASREDAYALVAGMLPLRRVAAPEEIAAAALFLASAESSFMTGSLLIVDGGGTAVDVGMLPFVEG